MLFSGINRCSTSSNAWSIFCLETWKFDCYSISLSLQERLQDISGANPENPPASPSTIDALPIVVFGQVSDEFNQTEWSVIKDF